MEKITPGEPQGIFTISGSRTFTADEIKATVKDLGYSLVSIK